MAPPTIGWTLPHWSQNEKMPYSWIARRYFLSWSSFFWWLYSLCEVDIQNHPVQFPCHTCNPSTQKFKVISYYIVSSRLAWTCLKWKHKDKDINWASGLTLWIKACAKAWWPKCDPRDTHGRIDSCKLSSDMYTYIVICISPTTINVIHTFLEGEVYWLVLVHGSQIQFQFWEIQNGVIL